MSAQPDEGCWMLASRGYFDPGVYRLTFRGGVVLQEQKVTYLGTVLDRRMTMSPHIEHLMQKATKSIGLLRFTAAQNVQQRSLLMLMKATVGCRL